MQTIKLIFEFPLNDDDKIRVSFEFLKGICVLDLSIRADMQFPKLYYFIKWINLDKDPLMHVSSYILSSLSSIDISCGILNFSEPAKSTILNYKIKINIKLL